MAKRITLGLNFFFNNNTNSGIVNYIYNIIAALNTLTDIEKPRIIVFYSLNSPISQLQEIEYPYISYSLFNPYASNIVLRKTNTLFYKIFKINIYCWFNYFRHIDIIYPYFESMDAPFIQIKNKVHWLVDFNNKVFPEQYADNAKSIDEFQQRLTKKSDRIVLSSNSLLKELRHFYPYYKNKVHILRFACSLPDLNKYIYLKIAAKYDLKEDYLMSPNQFWEHKNQLVVIEALRLLKASESLKFTIVFSGSMLVHRGKGHILDKLRVMINEYGLTDNVKFLGVLDRHEQLVLMKNAKALIQPSLYEGWSTLVEEAKALNQKIILSDLPVHREQNCKNSYFFDPHSPEKLAGHIKNILSNNEANDVIDYSDNIFEFGKSIYKMINNLP